MDVERNLRAPLVGIGHAAERLGLTLNTPTVGMRTGDTAADQRRRLARNPPDLLITTPESLYLMLTSAARETLVNVEAVIIDEIHAVAATKRGSHLALTLERLGELCVRPPQRIGLSATQRPLDEIARFLGGFDTVDADGGAGSTGGAPPATGARRLVPRPVTIVDAGTSKPLELEVVVPADGLGGTHPMPPTTPVVSLEQFRAGQAAIGDGASPPGPASVNRSVWPAMHPMLLELVRNHRSTLIFVNARRLAERLATRLNELASETGLDGSDPSPRFTSAEAVGAPPADFELVKAHHGSLSRERRLSIEDDLKSGRLRGLVATSSLELGIDMGAVDLVIQVESPGSVSRGLQRIGRAGHQVGEPSRGKVFPKHRGDLVEAAVVTRRMREGLIESTRYPRNPLDVLAQQVVAACAMEDWAAEDLYELVRRAAPYADLSRPVWEAVLDMLAGRYPSEDFAELRPRLVWDRAAGRLSARPGAQRLAVTNGGTIPDRGLYGVFLPDGARVGELDEEMVYESRVGETFLLGASTWRIEEITPERVVVTPAPGQPGRMPFWRGDGPGRPIELGRALGEFTRGIRSLPEADARRTLREDHHLDERATETLLGFLAEQAESTGAVPDDRTIVVERFRDEIGDWRICIHSPFGARVHAPWALVLRARLAEEWGVDVELIWSDDGIVVRLPDAVDRIPSDLLTMAPEDLDEVLLAVLPSSSLFASRFREAAARALLLPRRRPDRRTPLWQQRQKAADLLAVAAGHPSFPILLETVRECSNDVFDLPALRSLLEDLRARRVRMVEVDTAQASPMAQSLLFGWIAVYMYEGDAPLAERRAAALALDRDLLRELMGSEELRELLDPEVLADLEAELQRLTERRRARDPHELVDLLRVLGPLTPSECVERASVLEMDVSAASTVQGWLSELVGQRRVIEVTVADEARFAAAEDAARLRDALGCALPPGLPTAFTDPVPHPLEDLVVRFARTHGPFLVRDVATRLGVDVARVGSVLDELVDTGRLVVGEFRPGGVEREWCDAEVLRQLRRRSLAALRAEVEPVDGAVLARFLPVWQRVADEDSGARPADDLVEVLGVLAGAAIPASVLETDVLPVRIPGYRGSDLDQLCTSGELVWVGAGSIGAGDGRVRLVFRDQVETLVPGVDPAVAQDLGTQPVHRALLDHLAERGASFWEDLVRAAAAAGVDYADQVVLTALWDLVWAGLVTNDSLAPVRAFVSGASASRSVAARRAAPPARPRPGRLSRLGPPTASGRWSLVDALRQPYPGHLAVAPTALAHARAVQLLDRYGILTRETALAEGIEGGFAGVYPVLKAMEEQGLVRRGYFVAGLGAAQFAVPGAVDRLRDRRPAETVSGQVLVLAATDPAQPYGAALAWPAAPGRPARAAGALVVLVDGEAAVFTERGGRSLLVFPAGLVDPAWAYALAGVVRSGRRRAMEISRIDGAPSRESPHADLLRQAGFSDGYRGLVLRNR